VIIASFPGLTALTAARVRPKSATTDPGSLRAEGPQGLRRRRPHHPRQRQEPDPSCTAGSRTTGSSSRLQLGVLRADCLTGVRADYRRRNRCRRPARAAQRNLYSRRLLGHLWHCLITCQGYDETTGFLAATKNYPRQFDNLTDVPAAQRAWRRESCPWGMRQTSAGRRGTPWERQKSEKRICVPL